MKRAVSVSLGSPSRDKKVVVTLKGQQISIERIGTGGDTRKAKQLFTELDGHVDALSLGGMDMYVRLDGRDYPIHAAIKLVKNVYKTPVIDGRILKYVLERQVFEKAAPLLGGMPHFRSAIIPTAVDRMGLAQSVSAVADKVVIGDLMFTLGIPYPIWGIERFKKLARILLPIIGFFPLSMISPPGTKDEPPKPKHHRFWNEADLIAGDLHYIRRYSPFDLAGKTVVTNTTTPENIEMLKERGVKRVITTTPRYEGRSFGVNMMEAVLTAYSGKNRQLSEAELEALVEEIELQPYVEELNP